MLVLVQPEQRNVQKAEGIAGNRCLKLADIEHIFFRRGILESFSESKAVSLVRVQFSS